MKRVTETTSQVFGANQGLTIFFELVDLLTYIFGIVIGMEGDYITVLNHEPVDRWQAIRVAPMIDFTPARCHWLWAAKD